MSTRGREVLLGLGANVGGAWGAPADSLARAVRELDRLGIRVRTISRLRRTAPIGPRWQPDFINAAALIETDRGPARLLTDLKRLERAAGRRRGVRWGPRPLDLDILDFGHCILNWTARPPSIRPRLVLPHPELHRRVFALEPICEIAPGWRHPVLGVNAAALMRRLQHGRLRPRIDGVLPRHYGARS